MRQIEYGVPTDKCAVPVRLGIEKGFFKDEGIDLSVRIIFGGPPLAAAYDSGILQFGEIGSPPCVNAISRGARFKIVGGAARRKAHLYLGVRVDIGDFHELRGKRLGLLSMGSCPEWFARKIFRKEGLDPDRDIVFVPLLDEYPRIVSVLREGRIDAVLAQEPNLALGESQGLLRVWAGALDEPYLPRFQWMVVVARTDLIEQEPELIRALLRAYRRSAHYAAEHPDEWVAFASRRFGIDRKTVWRAVERELPHLHLDCQVDLEGLQRVIGLQQELGAVTGSLLASEIVDLRFVP
jgi:ABC-type nitrate/sulfonate/bicarbonate transport system substrate-binding protein